jgi:arabinofuranosyltransferase
VSAARFTRVEGVALALALLVAAACTWPLRHYLTDDTFIHLQYARNLAEGQGFVFNPGERVYGSTSPLWVLLLAVPIALGADGLLAARVLGGLATLAALLLWVALARRTIARPWLRAASTVAWSAHAWMARWSLSGMETPLAVALVLAGFVTFAGTTPWGGRPRRTSLLWALAALVRPECLLLVLLFGLALLVDHGPWRGLRRALASLWPALLVHGAWLAFAFAWFGDGTPNTLAAKAAGGIGLAYHLEQLQREAAIVAATDGVAVVVLVVTLALRAVRGERPRRRPALVLLPWAWLVAVPLLYMVRGVPVLSRYVVPLLPVLAWLAWRSLDRVLADGEPAEAGVGPAGERHAAARAFAAGVTVALLIVLQNLVTWQRVVRPQVDSFSAGLRQSLLPWGTWFHDHAPADAVIAAPDIGALGYQSRRRVVDLAGLVTPAMVPVLEQMSQEDAVARFEFARFSRPTFLVDRAASAWDLQRRSPYAAALVPLGHAEVPNLGVARPEPAVYTFYRIDWATYDSLRAPR